MKQFNWLMGTMAILTLVLAGSALAQGGGGGRPGGPGGNFDPAQFQQMMMNRMKEQLGATDDEFKVLWPKIEAVQTAQRENWGGGFGGRGFGGPGGPGGAQQSAVQLASAELRQALDSKDTPAEVFEKKLSALREARANARKKIEDAQKQLKELLTVRQEAALVSMGILE
ncbi:MAG: hypothetical protein ACHRHE_14995 [Tepidisphaerales bacterium]